MKISMTQSLLDVLADGGARDVFGIVGDAINPFVKDVIADDRFRWLSVRHEEHAAYAASAQGQLDGRIGVCAGTSGPGALHLINGLYNAKAEGAGVVAITGQVPQGQRGTDYHKEMDLTRVFADVCDYQAIIETPEQMPRLAEIAVQKSLLERAVTRIEIPANLINQAISGERYHRPIVNRPSRSIPDAESLQEAAGLINDADKVTLFCGIGCRKARAEVLELATRIGAAIVYSVRAKDIFDGVGSPVVGMTGNIGSPAGMEAVDRCDVLVMLGTDFPYDEYLPDERTVIQIDRNASHIGRRVAANCGLVADITDAVAGLLPLLRRREAGTFLSQLLLMHEKWRAQMLEQGDPKRDDEPLHPQVFARAVSEHAAHDALFAVDVGECTVWTARQVEMSGERRMVGGFNHGSIGCGLPVAIGAQALHEGRQVWALCGDGGFGMAMNDFITAVRYGWPLKILVFNNSEFGFVKMEMEVSGMPHDFAATGLLNPDFAAYAECCGGHGIRVEHAADVVPAIREANASDKPVIIDAIVSAGELVMPPKVTFDEVWGFGTAKVKEAMLGVRGDHGVWDNWRDEFNAVMRR